MQQAICLYKPSPKTREIITCTNPYRLSVMTISDNGQGHCKSKRSSGPYQSITIETKLDIQSFTKNFVLKNEKKM